VCSGFLRYRQERQVIVFTVAFCTLLAGCSCVCWADRQSFANCSIFRNENKGNQVSSSLQVVQFSGEELLCRGVTEAGAMIQKMLRN